MATASPDGRQPKPGAIPSAISVALESNLALQAELKRRLLQIRRLRVQNRSDAARVSASLSLGFDDDEDYTPNRAEFRRKVMVTGSTSKNDASGGGKGEPVKGDEKTVPIDGDGETDGESDPKSKSQGSAKVAPNPMAKLLKSPKWAPNPNRKGTRGYFVDPDGSTPDAPCDDIVIGGAAPMETYGPRVIFERRNAPLTSLDGRQKAWNAVRKRKWPATSEEVALRVDRTAPCPEEDRPIAHFTFADSGIAKTKFSMQECKYLVSMIGESAVESGGSIDWHEVATKHHVKFRKQTPWQCFCKYRSSLQSPTSRMPQWSPDEDELLLKYIAAHGPQLLLEGESMVQLVKNMFPLRTPAQLALRTNSTLLYPNYVHDAWDTDEKRKLAILMRIYCKEKYPINVASRAVHFPHRAPKSVMEKWAKTLDPASRRPGATGEDDEMTVKNTKRRRTVIAGEQPAASDGEDRLMKREFV